MPHLLSGYNRIGLDGQPAEEGRFFGDHVADVSMGTWDYDQPDILVGKCVAAAINAERQYPWSFKFCNDPLPFLCQMRACLDSEQA